MRGRQGANGRRQNGAKCKAMHSIRHFDWSFRFHFHFEIQPDTRAPKAGLRDFGKVSGKVATRVSFGGGRAISSVRDYVESADNFVTIGRCFFLKWP
jgi:hypothetical protein